MPFYLVTQKTLVEANNETDAARKVLASLTSADRVEFTVRYDEANIKTVSVRPEKALDAAAPGSVPVAGGGGAASAIKADKPDVPVADISVSHPAAVEAGQSRFQTHVYMTVLSIACLATGLLAGWMIAAP